MGHVINFDQSQSENFRNKKSAAKIRNTKILAFWLVNYDCINLNILHFDWLNLLPLKKKIRGGEGKYFPLGVSFSSPPAHSSPLRCLSSLSSLASFSYLSNFVNPPVITSMSLLFRVTYLGQHLFVYVPALFLSIHSSVPHLPDSDTIFVLHSLYHMCKLGLFHWHLPFVTYSDRSCAVAVHP